MSKLQRKLRSRTGASMILALLFLMFCSFVGGSVLVSATANAYRVAHHADQQDFLNQRSAVLLLSDELQLEQDQILRLLVLDNVKTTTDVQLGNGGSYNKIPGTDSTERVITFQLVTTQSKLTPLQRLMLETTIWRYLRENNVLRNSDGTVRTFTDREGNALTIEKTSVVVSGFKDTSGNELELDDFWYSFENNQYWDSNTNTIFIPDTSSKEIEGNLRVSGDLGQEVTGIGQFIEYDIHFSCEDGEDLYDFAIDFGEASQLQLTMNAYNGVTGPTRMTSRLPKSTDPSGKTFIQADSQIIQTIISWNDPAIEKGGA